MTDDREADKVPPPPPEEVYAVREAIARADTGYMIYRPHRPRNPRD